MKTAGGQAVIEGVMMMSGNKINTSVRKGKKIVFKTKRLKKKSKLSKILFVRGIINLFSMLKIGLSSLIWSAEQQSEEDEEKISKKEIVLSISLSIFFAILLFVIVPFYATKLFTKDDGFLFNIIDGIIRVGIFLGYVIVISLMKDIRRVFEYHGAEHKVVNCYESGKKLTVVNAKKFSKCHTRCGTSFILIILLISVVIFSFITAKVWYLKIGFRILLLPVIAGISYEVLKVSTKFKKNLLFRLVNKPGLLIQKITTKEPDNKQIEVAIHSLKKVI
jgi:uncharacterized protein YqhQ